MKVLLFKPYTMLEGAGNKIWFFKIIPELRKLGYEFIIVDTDIGPKNLKLKEILDFCKKNNVQYETLRCFPKVNFLTPNSFSKLLELSKNVDLIYYVTAEAFFDPYFFLISLKKPVIGGWHAPFYFDNRIHNIYQKLFKPFFCKKFTANHVVAPSQVKILKKNGLKNIQFIAHGVQLEKFKPLVSKWNSKTFNVLFVGRFEKQKGFDVLIEGLKLFLNKIKDKNIEINLIGDGSLSSLIDIKDKRVNILGFQKDPSFFFAKSHVFILPSRQEPWGHVVLEAMASGDLLIASKTEGPLYIAGKNKAGWFLDKLSDKDIAKKLYTAYNLFNKERNNFKKIGEQSRKRIKEEFSFEKHIENMNTFFNRSI